MTRTYELYDYNGTALADILNEGGEFGFEVKSWVKGGEMEYVATLSGPRECLDKWEKFFDMKPING